MGKGGGVNGFEKKEGDGLDIPEFLRRKPGEKKTQTDGGSAPAPPPDPVWERQRQLREAHEEQRKAKRYKALDKLKAERGRWDPKKRQWIKE